MTLFDGVVTFPGSFHALRAETAVRGAGCACRLIPSPRDLHASCAVSLAFMVTDVDRIVEVLARHRVRCVRIYVAHMAGPQPPFSEWRRG
jgi:hypothetical protein